MITLREALLCVTENNKIRCNLCVRRCLIPIGSTGFCKTRHNIDGKLFFPMYGELSMVGVDPIEKKPFFHFFPQSTTLSISTIGCTFRCKFCQNYDISQNIFKMQKLEPREVVTKAKEMGCRSISYTYNEPTVFFEYVIDTAKEGIKEGLANTLVTNGYMTAEAVQYASQYIQAMTVGIKGSLNKEFLARFMAVQKPDAIKDTLLNVRKAGIHLEITDLLVTKYGDDLDDVKNLMKWIHDNLGPEIPIHFTRFHPDWLLLDVPPTSIITLERAYSIAKKEGMNYVYIGNVINSTYENTYCPNCDKLLIKRSGFNTSMLNIKNKKCIYCDFQIYLVE